MLKGGIENYLNPSSSDLRLSLHGSRIVSSTDLRRFDRGSGAVRKKRGEMSDLGHWIACTECTKGTESTSRPVAFCFRDRSSGLPGGSLEDSTVA